MQPRVGTLLFWLYMLVGFFVLVNMFVAIISDACAPLPPRTSHLCQLHHTMMMLSPSSRIFSSSHGISCLAVLCYNESWFQGVFKSGRLC